MLKMRNNLIIGLLLSLSAQVMAFPLYYKCGAGDRLDDSFAGPEILNQVQSLLAGATSESDFQQQAYILCQGANECLQEINRVKALIGDTQNIMTAVLNTKSRYHAETIGSAVDPAQYERVKMVVDQAYTLHACQEVKKTWSPQSWTGRDNDTFAVFYPKYNNYMYASGCSGRSSSANCAPNRISNYKDKIKSALLMGMDPYLAIALVWMEGGTVEGLNYLYLDPIAKFGALGCRSTPRSSSEATDRTLNSYGTYYDIKPAVIKNAALNNKLKDFQKAKGSNPQSGKSYFCRMLTDDLGMVYDTPQEDSCCLEMPITAESANIELIEEALVFEQARKNYQTRFRGMEDPAFRIQRFNGYSRLMGGAEPVEAFRAGVNHYDDPAYGYQAMDYMVNSILPNPVIRDMVQTAEREVAQTLGREASWRSIMCVEHPGGGTFQVDSSTYFLRHRDTPRLQAGFERWSKGEALTGAEERLVQLEMQTLIEKGKAPESDLDVAFNEIVDNYFKKYYPERRTVGLASSNQSTYDWRDLSNTDLSNVGNRVLNQGY